MKLSYPEWEKTVCMEEQDIPVISMENPLYHYDRLMELYRQIQGDTGGFVLFEEEPHLDLRKKSVLLLSPLDMDFNNRKILTKLFAALREEAMTESFYRETRTAMGNILTYAEHLSQQVPLPLTYDMDVDLIEMMKAIHLRIDMEGTNLPEQMLSFMKNWNILFGETCFFFHGFRDILPKDIKESFYNNALEEKLQFILLEGKCYDKIELENLFIIDEDLCQIFE